MTCPDCIQRRDGALIGMALCAVSGGVMGFVVGVLAGVWL